MPRGIFSRGIVSVEIALLAIGLLGGMHMLMFAGRLSEARGLVQDVAAEAARIASQAQNKEDAKEHVDAFVADALSDRCASHTATLDGTSFRRGSSVSVSLSCVVRVSDLSLVKTPGNITLEAQAAEVIEVLRSGV